MKFQFACFSIMSLELVKWLLKYSRVHQTANYIVYIKSFVATFNEIAISRNARRHSCVEKFFHQQINRSLLLILQVQLINFSFGNAMWHETETIL